MSNSVLFVREYPLVDGTFTLLLRLAQKIHEDGRQAFFLFPDKQIDTSILKEASKWATIYYWKDLKCLKNQNKLPQIDAILSIVEGDSLLKVFHTLKKNYFPLSKMVFGVYHARAFFSITRLGPTPDTLMHKMFFRKAPSQNIVFMHDEVKKSHQDFFKLPFAHSPVIPLPVNIPTNSPARIKGKKNKIVSIGRLVDFKNYVFPVIKAVKKLRSNGYPLEYHIYGDGPLKKSIEEFIVELQAGEYVFLHGPLPYSDMRKVLEDAFVFVGMGTVIIESSSYGVPTLLAYDSEEREICYGWFYENKGLDIGERIEGKKTYDYTTLIQELFTESDMKYTEVCLKSWQKSKEFSTESIIGSYYSFFENADAEFYFRFSIYKKLFLKISRQPYKFRFLQLNRYNHR